jgi:hypothetical protein
MTEIKNKSNILRLPAVKEKNATKEEPLKLNKLLKVCHSIKHTYSFCCCVKKSCFKLAT